MRGCCINKIEGLGPLIRLGLLTKPPASSRVRSLLVISPLLGSEKCERRRGSSSRRTSPARISELLKGIIYIIFFLTTFASLLLIFVELSIKKLRNCGVFFFRCGLAVSDCFRYIPVNGISVQSSQA